jgi:hypothetical protein
MREIGVLANLTASGHTPQSSKMRWFINHSKIDATSSKALPRSFSNSAVIGIAIACTSTLVLNLILLWKYVPLTKEIVKRI